MTAEEIMNGLKEVLTLVRPSIDVTSVSPASRLIEDLGLDSLSMLLMSLGIENKFSIRFEGSPQLRTVQDVIDYVINASK